METAKNHMERALKSVHNVQPKLEDGPLMRELSAYIRAALHASDELYWNLKGTQAEIEKAERDRLARQEFEAEQRRKARAEEEPLEEGPPPLPSEDAPGDDDDDIDKRIEHQEHEDELESEGDAPDARPA